MIKLKDRDFRIEANSDKHMTFERMFASDYWPNYREPKLVWEFELFGFKIVLWKSTN